MQLSVWLHRTAKDRGLAKHSLFDLLKPQGAFKEDSDWWISMVDHGAPWDYKANRPPWLLSDKFYFGGKMITIEEYRNIHYAFVGRAQGWTLEELKLGSIYAAHTNSNADRSTGLDGAGDQENIDWGSSLYDLWMSR